MKNLLFLFFSFLFASQVVFASSIDLRDPKTQEWLKKMNEQLQEQSHDLEVNMKQGYFTYFIMLKKGYKESVAEVYVDINNEPGGQLTFFINRNDDHKGKDYDLLLQAAAFDFFSNNKNLSHLPINYDLSSPATEKKLRKYFRVDRTANKMAYLSLSRFNIRKSREILEHFPTILK